MKISREITSLIDEIRNDKTHGASQLARQAVNILKLAAERSQADTTKAFLLEQREMGLSNLRGMVCKVYKAST